MGSRFASLRQQASDAWTARDWSRVEEASRAALEAAAPESVPHGSLVELARQYLGAILGSGAFLNYPDDGSARRVAGKLEEFTAWVQRQPVLTTMLAEYVNATREILFLAVDATDMGRNKLASRLRVIARPDLAIDLTTEILAHSRLNYYALTTRGAAYADLGDFSAAIADLELAQRFVPDDMRARTLTSLSRAYRQRYAATHDYDDAERALECAKTAWADDPTAYAANAYLAAAKATADLDEIEEATAAVASARTRATQADPLAAQHAIEVLEAAEDQDWWDPPF